MGKNLIQQARGKGGPRYRAPSFRYAGEAKIRSLHNETITGEIIDILKCQGHTAPLARIKYDDGEFCLLIAPEGVRIGEQVQAGPSSEIKSGNTLELKNIPEGTAVYNLESRPGDGGKFCRSSGTFAKVISKTPKGIIVQLPSKKQKLFNENCRANIGIIAGSGRVDKPLLKAGNKFYKMKAKNKLYPHVSGSAQNAVDHPFGNKRSSRKSKARPTSKNASPGRKVGMIGARRTGRKKR